MKRAMIVWGGWEGHEPEPGAAYVAAMLRDAGFEVRVEGDIDAFADPAVREMDLIVPCITRAAIAKEPLDNLLADKVSAYPPPVPKGSQEFDRNVVRRTSDELAFGNLTIDQAAQQLVEQGNAIIKP